MQALSLLIDDIVCSRVSEARLRATKRRPFPRTGPRQASKDAWTPGSSKLLSLVKPTQFERGRAQNLKWTGLPQRGHAVTNTPSSSYLLPPTMAANSTNGSASTLSETPATPRVLEELHSPIFAALHEAKAKNGMSFEDVAKAIGRSEVYTAAM